MPITVQFATNRVLTGNGTAVSHYSNGVVTPSDPSAMTYGTAFVDEVDLTADTVGAITEIQDLRRGGFSQQAVGDLGEAGRNLLVFVHGFDNSFENAITRAAFVREWLAGTGETEADTTVIAFSWPSLGRLLSFPVPWSDYQQDQTMAGRSGLHLMSFFANLQPIIAQARWNGRRVFLVTHSMGNWALQSAIENWFSHGRAATALFDEVILAAADERYDSFEFPSQGRLSGLAALSRHVSMLFSEADAVLTLSMAINLGAKRLGQDGPHFRFDVSRFPPSRFTMVDCTQVKDYDVGFASSHQYYRRSPIVRNSIVAALARPLQV